MPVVGLQDLLQRGSPLESYEEQQARIATDEVQRAVTAAETWLAKHKAACDFHSLAVEDYIAARGAVLAMGLFRSGFSTAALSIEKFLKAYLIALGQDYKYGHRINVLMDRVEQCYPAMDFSNFRDFACQLENWWDLKYPDNRLDGGKWSRGAIQTLDELVLLLEESFPIAPDAKHILYSGGWGGFQWPSIFVRLFGSSYSQHYRVLILENDALGERTGELWERFTETRMLSLSPATTSQEESVHRAKYG